MITLVGLVFAFLLAVFGFLTVRHDAEAPAFLMFVTSALILGLTLGRLLPF